MATSELTLKQGEAKTIQFNIKNADGTAALLTNATLFLGVKKSRKDEDYAFSKEDADFNKEREADGIVTFELTKTDTGQDPGIYVGELQCSWAGPPDVIDKSVDIKINILRAVIPVPPANP